MNLILYGGCVGNYYAPDVCIAIPAEPGNYNLVKKDGIDVYIYEDADIERDGLKIYIPTDWRMAMQVNVLMADGLIFGQPYNVKGKLL